MEKVAINILDNPKLMDVAVPTNKKLGMSLNQQKKLNGLSVVEVKKIINSKDCWWAAREHSYQLLNCSGYFTGGKQAG